MVWLRESGVMILLIPRLSNNIALKTTQELWKKIKPSKAVFFSWMMYDRNVFFSPPLN